MKVIQSRIPEVLIIEPGVFGNAPGFFVESVNQKAFDEVVGQDVIPVQDSRLKRAKSAIGCFGDHMPPKIRGKLVRVSQGDAFHVVDDIGNDSKTDEQCVGSACYAEDKKQFSIPHGFVTLSETAELLYKTTDRHSQEYERPISWKEDHLPNDEQMLGVPPVSRRKVAAAKFTAADLF